MYTIIEDCSPYYIRFTWPGLREFVNYVASLPIDLSTGMERSAYIHYRFEIETAKSIISKLPMKDKLNFNHEQVSIFSTFPEKQSVIHKDGSNNRYSINVPTMILDNKCYTSWYPDEAMDNFEKLEDDYSRIVKHPKNLKPLKTTVLQPNECILFNTDIYHGWDNRKSFNKRNMLMIRDIDPGNIYFDDVKKILFKI